MSDRSFVSSDRAFGSLLSSMRRRASTAKRRQRWPGATQLALDDAFTIVLPPALGVTTWQNMLPITLDPGSWVLLATATLRLQADTAAVNLFRAGLSFTDDERSEIAGPDLGTPSTPGDQRLEVSLSAYFRLVSRTTVTLRGQCSYQGTLSVDPLFEDIYILAIPT